jgi:hypothetical protein
MVSMVGTSEQFKLAQIPLSPEDKHLRDDGDLSRHIRQRQDVPTGLSRPVPDRYLMDTSLPDTDYPNCK